MIDKDDLFTEIVSDDELKTSAKKKISLLLMPHYDRVYKTLQQKEMFNKKKYYLFFDISENEIFSNINLTFIFKEAEKNKEINTLMNMKDNVIPIEVLVHSIFGKTIHFSFYIEDNKPDKNQNLKNFDFFYNIKF